MNTLYPNNPDFHRENQKLNIETINIPSHKPTLVKRNIENTQPEAIKPAKLDDYEYQKTLRKIYKSPSGYCAYYPVKDKEGKVKPPEMRYNTDPQTGKEFHYHTNLQTCSSPWKCIRCSKAKAQQEKIAISYILNRLANEGKHVSMITLTIPHKKEDSLKFSIHSLFSAFAKLKNSKRFKIWKPKLGYFGDIRSLEITHGEFGWHPHIHLGIITDLPMTEELIDELRTMYELAFKNVNSKRRMGKSGFTVSEKPQIGNWDNFAEYLTKVESKAKWGIDKELTQDLKKTSPGESIWDMIEEAHKQMEAGKEANKEKEAERKKIEGKEYKETPPENYVSKFLKDRIIEYCIETKNKRKIVFSDGLRAYGELQKEKEAAENEKKEVGKGLRIKYTKLEWLAVDYYINPDKFVKKVNENSEAALQYLKEITEEYSRLHPYLDTRWDYNKKMPCLPLYNLPGKELIQ